MSAELDLDAASPPIPRLCRYLSERSPQPTVAVDGTTHVVAYLNDAFARLVGRARQDLIGRPFAEAVPEGAGNGCLALLDRVFRTGTAELLAEQEHRQAGPRPVYWSYSVWAILGADDRPAGVMIQVTDATEAAISRQQAVALNEALIVSSVRQHELIETIQQGELERQALEAERFQAEKLESLGVLASGIAHDLNNILTPVIGYAELASNSMPAGSTAGPLLGEVVRNAHRAADLVSQILAYAGKGRFVIQPVDLTRLVREMDGLLRVALPPDTTLVYDLSVGLPAVAADATQLGQVVMNLVRNAAEAIGESAGVVTVRTGVLPAASDANPTPLPGVYLEVQDTGCGMPAEVLGKVFDPFYSTKFTGRGLGLAVVQGIARGHGGSLHVRSEPGRGSTFRLVLPRTDAVPPTAVPKAEPPASRPGDATVLVIDDEGGVRALVAHILGGAGFAVLHARDGEEGLRVFGEHRAGVDLVVLDLTMPRISGLDVARRLRAVRPDLPVVLMSGFSVEEVSEQSVGLDIAGVLQKPFTATDLLAAVRRGLGQ